MVRTAHLSLSAAGFLDRLQCWIWENSDDQCSIADDPAAISIATRVSIDEVGALMAEIMNPHAPLLKLKNGRLFVGHFEKQLEVIESRSAKAKESIAKRWKNQSDEPRNTNVSKSDTNVSSEHTNVSKTHTNVIHCNKEIAVEEEGKEGGGAGGGRKPDDFERALRLVNAAVPKAWQRGIWSRTEMEALRAGSVTEIEELSATDWQNLRDWFAARVPEGHQDPPRRVQSRGRLIENLVNEADKAAAWLKSNPTFRTSGRKPAPPPEPDPIPIDEEMSGDTASALAALKSSIRKSA